MHPDIAFVIAAQRREDLMRDASRYALARTASRRPNRVSRRVWPRSTSPATALLVDVKCHRPLEPASSTRAASGLASTAITDRSRFQSAIRPFPLTVTVP
jgi:hypothetical protein